MKKKRITQLRHQVASTRRISASAFGNLCIFLGLLVCFAGVLLVLFAAPVTGQSRGGETTPHLLTPAPALNLGTHGSRSIQARSAPSGAVQEAWVARYTGPGNGDDEANAIAVDGAGNVYVTGYSWGSRSGRDYTTIKYDSAGQQQWVARYNGPGNNDDMAAAIAIDGAGNVYVTGGSVNLAGNLDYATIKYNSAGQEQWVARYDGQGGQFHLDSAVAITVDSAGNVYVTGTSEGVSTGLDYATIKYNSDGQEQWVARGLGGYNDFAAALAVDGSGNVYVTGTSGSDYGTVKYNSAGQQLWIARYNGAQASAMALDGSGNVYVTGTRTSGPDYATVKYNSAGQQLWVASYPGTRAAAVGVDTLGNVYVTGYSSSCVNYDYATIKYNSTGQDQWVARYNGPGNTDDRASSMAIDNSGNVYVTGSSAGDFATVKYNSAGQEQWLARYNGPGNGADSAVAVAVDASGDVYVTGTSWGSGTNWDYATIKYMQTPAESQEVEIPEPTATSQPTPTPTATASPTPTPIPCQVFQNFDGVTPPALPTGWTTNGISPDGIFWRTSNSGLPSPPADSPPNAAWVNDPDATSDKYLNSPSISVDPLKNAVLTFRTNYALENGRDGGVLEISIDGGPFQDILSTGAYFLQGGYNGIIAADSCSPIGGRQAWTGSSGGFMTTSVDLAAPSILGHVIMLRWRMASDFSGVPSEGWRIDTIQLLCAGPTPTATPTATATATSTPTANPTPTARPNVTPRIRPTPPPRA